MAKSDLHEPSRAEFQKAFELIRPKLNSAQLTMLEAHFRAPNHVLTATELASAAGYDNFGPANSQYGKVGTLLRKALGPAYERFPGQRSYIFLWFRSPGKGRSWELHMKEEVVDALKALGWFGRASAPEAYLDEHRAPE
jgi:hypothetical protein